MPVIFLHIPKTAGTNIYNILYRQYKPENRFLLQNKNDVLNFIRLPEEKKEKIEILAGHQDFGLHLYFNKPSSYFAFMRNPVERTISSYYYYLNNPSFPAAVKMKENNIRSLKEFVQCGLFPMEDNLQSRFIGGGRNIPFGKCTGELLEKAQENIEKIFSVVGTEEKYDETLLILKNIYQWKTFPFYTRQNVNPNRPPKEELDNETLKAIKEVNEIDEKLYSFVSNRLAGEISEQAFSFQKQLHRFKMLNGIYGKLVFYKNYLIGK